MELDIQLFGGRGASSSSELDRLKENVGNYGKSLKKANDLRYENGKLIRKTKVGDREEPDRAVRNVNDYKIYARHFNSNLPYTHYYIANTKSGVVYEIPEVVTEWNSGVLKDIADGIRENRKKTKQVGSKGFNPLDF